jgi:hypothetical protein
MIAVSHVFRSTVHVTGIGIIFSSGSEAFAYGLKCGYN